MDPGAAFEPKPRLGIGPSSVGAPATANNSRLAERVPAVSPLTNDIVPSCTNLSMVNTAKSVSFAVETGQTIMTNQSLRSSAFSSKIRSLNEYYQHVTSSQQLPSGLNIVNTLRYFQQTLLGILRELSGDNLAPFMRLNSEPPRSSLLPNLNYTGLYNALNNIIDIYPLVTTGQIALGNAILNTMQCLYLFLDKEHAEQLPYNVTSLLSIYPAELYPDILRLLCSVLLPFTLLNETGNTYVTSCLSGILMLVFQYCKDPRHHTWLIETLMPLKNDLYKDILSVIAHGTSESRVPAANLLFHYWPLAKQDYMDRRNYGYRIHAWAPTRCQQHNCNSGDDNSSVKKCYNPSFCAEYGDMAPPMFLCNQCSKEVADNLKPSLMPYFQPLSTLANICQNKECTSSNRLAVATCFSEECVRLNNYIPSRLCERCHRERHPASHTYVDAIPPVWGCEATTFADMICAVVSLLKETSVVLEEMVAEKRPKWLQGIEAAEQQKKELYDERRMLSRYGIKMLVRFCPPSADAPDNAVGRLLAAVFQWFGTTALLPSDSVGASIEQLKSEVGQCQLCLTILLAYCSHCFQLVSEWLRPVIDTKYDVFVQCLLPNPPCYAKVGGAWDKLSLRCDQLKEGLGKMLALIPYDLISLQTWEHIMPEWFNVMSSEIPEEDLMDLKVLLSKIFEVDLCSLPFPVDQMYRFILSRFQGSRFKEQESALGWLQLLTDVDIVIPMPTLLNLLEVAAVNVLQLQPGSSPLITKDPLAESDSENELDSLSEVLHTHRESVFSYKDNTNVVMFIIILDILMRQMELSKCDKHAEWHDDLAQTVASIVVHVVKSPWCGVHMCTSVECDQYADCMFCRDSTVFFQLAMEVVEALSPKSPSLATPMGVCKSVRPSISVASGELGKADAEEEKAREISLLHKRASMVPGGRELGDMNLWNPVVEEYPEEFVGILPVEEPEVVTAEAVTIADDELEDANCKVVTTTLMDVVESPSSSAQTAAKKQDEFWYTRQGKFRIRLEELPLELQLIHALMTTIESHPNPDVKYYMLCTVKTLCINCNALTNAQFEYRGFLIWAQENILISKFWKLLQCQYSQISEVCTTLIFHCLALPYGVDILWSVINADFINDDFSTRFAAVEKVTAMSWFIDQSVVKSSLVIQGALAHAFVYLISATNDRNSTLAQQALICLQTIKESSLQCLCMALELQFDSVIEDRSLIMHQFLILSSVLPSVLVLNWNFFMSRFEIISAGMQAQLNTSSRVAYAGGVDYSLVDLGGRSSRPSISVSAVDSQARSICRYIMQTTAADGKKETFERFMYAETPKGKTEGWSAEGPLAFDGADLKDPSATMQRLNNFLTSRKFLIGSVPSLDDADQCLKESSRLLVTLFMKFLSNPCTAFVNADEKASAKKQSSVLRHLNLLLGYNVQERSFGAPPSRIRASPICNAFLAKLAKVLDGNVFFARQILPIASSLMLYMPSPDSRPSTDPSSHCTLWYLEPQVRHHWLWSLLVILYKYQFDQPPINESVLRLIQVVVNTLSAQVHTCSKVQLVGSPSFRSRNSSAGVSCESLSMEWDDTALETPLTGGSSLTVGGGKTAASTSPSSATVLSSRRPRRQALVPKRQYTFDEREEHSLAEERAEVHAARSLDNGQEEEVTSLTIEEDAIQPMEFLQSFPPVQRATVGCCVAQAKMCMAEEVAAMTASVIQPAALVIDRAVVEPCAAMEEGPVRATSVVLQPTLTSADTDRTCKSNVTVQSESVVPVDKVSSPTVSQSVFKPLPVGRSRIGESVIQCRCFHCNAILEICDEETISLGVVCLSTFIHRDPSMAAPHLLKILLAVSKIAGHAFHPWQATSHAFVPSNCRSVARQFIRIVLHQLANNRLFLSVFESDISDRIFFKTIASCLTDFQELTPVQVLQHLLEDLQQQNALPSNVYNLLCNLGEYLRHVPYDQFLTCWSVVVAHFDAFLRRMLLELPDMGLYVPLLFDVLNRLLRVSNFATLRSALGLLDTCCKFLSRLLLTYPVQLEDLISLCASCNRAFARERDKHTVTRCCLNEFCQALKFKHTLNDSNYVTVIKLILYDFGEQVDCELDRMMYSIAAVECARPFLMDFIDFLQDYHVLNRIKNIARENGGLSEDTLGSDLKIGLAKYVAYEIHRNVNRDSRAIYRYLPWLSAPPAVTQLGANDFVECIGRVRLLSWILIGSLSCTSSACSLAIPIDCSYRISDYIQFVLAGFAELSNQSVLNMSALFHAFHLCQLWTVYCEETALHAPEPAVSDDAIASIMDFWARITPAILQLLSHSKVLADMVNLHFLNSVEGLLEANSLVLTQLYAMWHPILAAYHSSIPSHLMVRLDFFENTVQSSAQRNLAPWLKKIGFKIGQVELQSSAATQFYSV